MTGLVLSDIHHAFGSTPVLKGVNVTADPGSLICLLGPSGCGKTTLLRIAAGLEPIQHGHVSLAGHEVANAENGLDLPPEQRGVGLMFQDFALFPHLTILQNVTFGEGAGTPERKAWALKQLDRFGLSATINAYPNQISGGQQQRVALLRALAPTPRVLLLDEPFSGLDATLRAQVRDDTFELLRETNITALMVTHDPEEAMAMADRIMVMRDGLVVQSGKPVEIYFQPIDGFVAQMFGPTNTLSGSVKDGHVDTPLGKFSTPSMADGDTANVLIRPEGIRPTHSHPARPTPEIEKLQAHRHPPSSPVTMTVLWSQLLGRSSQLRLRIKDGADLEISARVPGVYLPSAGETVDIVVDPQQAFVFSATSAA